MTPIDQLALRLATIAGHATASADLLRILGDQKLAESFLLDAEQHEAGITIFREQILARLLETESY